MYSFHELKLKFDQFPPVDTQPYFQLFEPYRLEVLEQLSGKELAVRLFGDKDTAPEGLFNWCEKRNPSRAGPGGGQNGVKYFLAEDVFKFYNKDKGVKIPEEEAIRWAETVRSALQTACQIISKHRLDSKESYEQCFQEICDGLRQIQHPDVRYWYWAKTGEPLGQLLKYFAYTFPNMFSSTYSGQALTTVLAKLMEESQISPTAFVKNGQLSLFGRQFTEDNLYFEHFLNHAALYDESGKSTTKQATGKSKEVETQKPGGTAVMATEIKKNTILYGPPGTGKTYSTVKYAVAICDNLSLEALDKLDYETAILPRYRELIEERRVAFTTFHQSYSYEDFIEGIRPVLQNGNGSLNYERSDGVFKQFCESASANTDFNSAWNMFIADVEKNGNTAQVPIKTRLRNISWDKDKQQFTVADYKSPIPCGNRDLVYKTFLGEDEWKDNNGSEYTKQCTCKAIVKVLRERYIQEAKVFIIDEINRGNISKIFGELITLIEESKRAGAKEAMKVILPYSKDYFSVPDNVYILGTMNTADRSIALMDTALRRRFSFVEMMPDPDKALDGAYVMQNEEKLSIPKMLNVMNRRIAVLYDREHTIGHAFFMKLKEDHSVQALAQIFEKDIIPLLQEYFFDDYSKIQLVLGDDGKLPQFQIMKKVAQEGSLFKKPERDMDFAESRIELQKDALMHIESYQQII